MQVDYSYDDIGRPTTVTYRNGNDVVYAQNYDYGSGTRVASISEEFEGAATTRDFEYDVDGRLTGVNVDGSATTFTYDDRGNRTTVVAGAATYDSSDRIVSAGPRTYSVDASGWVSGWTEAGQTTSLEYDGRDLMSGNVNGTVTTYGYDSMGRRVWRKVDGAFDRGWLYGRDNVPVAEVDGSGNLVSRFVYVTSDFTPDFMLRDGTTYMFVRDQVGSIRGVVDTSSGAVVQRIDYDALGRVTGDTNPGFQPFGFAGGLYDEATGLVRLGARDYDPYTGRWTSPDPRLFAGGPNLYAYAANDPVNIVDPRGEFGFAALIKPAIIAGVAIAGAGTAGLMADNLNHWGSLEKDSNRRANESRGRLGLERIDAENAMRHCIWQCSSSRRYGTDTDDDCAEGFCYLLTDRTDVGICGCTDDDADGFCADFDDCDDTDAAINPDADEICGNGIDEDCSGTPDDGCGDADMGTLPDMGSDPDVGANTDAGTSPTSSGAADDGGCCSTVHETGTNTPLWAMFVVAGLLIWRRRLVVAADHVAANTTE
jgi:RHS repeat-associated protein